MHDTLEVDNQDSEVLLQLCVGGIHVISYTCMLWFSFNSVDESEFFSTSKKIWSCQNAMSLNCFLKLRTALSRNA